MAGVNNCRGAYAVQFIEDGKKWRLYGFTVQREAVSFANHVEQLQTAKRTGAVSAALQDWIDRLRESNKKHYDQLYAAKLITQTQGTHTLNDIMEAVDRRNTAWMPSTRRSYKHNMQYAIRFFGGDTNLCDISQVDTDNFSQALANMLSNRGRVISPDYRVHIIRSLRVTMSYACELGWLTKNPVAKPKIPIPLDETRLYYAPVQDILRVLEACPRLDIKAMIALGRFCGLRGISEMRNLKWKHVVWPSDTNPGVINIPSEKNKRHGRVFRPVPLSDIVQSCLRGLNPGKPEDLIFNVKFQSTIVRELTKAIHAAGLHRWPNPWYNLRKSFCSDLLETITDISVYELIADHSYVIARKHYQIMHKDRLTRGLQSALDHFTSVINNPNKAVINFKPFTSNAETIDTYMQSVVDYFAQTK